MKDYCFFILHRAPHPITRSTLRSKMSIEYPTVRFLCKTTPQEQDNDTPTFVECPWQFVESCGAVRDLLQSTLDQIEHGCVGVCMNGALDVPLADYSKRSVEALVDYGRRRLTLPPPRRSLEKPNEFGMEFADALFSHEVDRALFMETLCLATFLDSAALTHDLTLYLARLHNERPLEEFRELMCIEDDLLPADAALLCAQAEWCVASDDEESAE